MGIKLNYMPCSKSRYRFNYNIYMQYIYATIAHLIMELTKIEMKTIELY